MKARPLPLVFSIPCLCSQPPPGGKYTKMKASSIASCARSYHMLGPKPLPTPLSAAAHTAVQPTCRNLSRRHPAGASSLLPCTPAAIGSVPPCHACTRGPCSTHTCSVCVLCCPANSYADSCTEHGVEVGQVPAGGLPPAILERPTRCCLLPVAVLELGLGPRLTQLSGLTYRGSSDKHVCCACAEGTKQAHHLLTWTRIQQHP